jgi:hypothetical protein
MKEWNGWYEGPYAGRKGTSYFDTVVKDGIKWNRQVRYADCPGSISVFGNPGIFQIDKAGWYELLNHPGRELPDARYLEVQEFSEIEGLIKLKDLK